MQHPAPAALARNSDESFAIGACGIDFVIDQRLWRVSDSKARAPDSIRHLGFLLVPARAWTEALVEGSDLLKHVGAKSHIRAEHPTHLDYFFAVVGDRQV